MSSNPPNPRPLFTPILVPPGPDDSKPELPFIAYWNHRRDSRLPGLIPSALLHVALFFTPFWLDYLGISFFADELDEKLIAEVRQNKPVVIYYPATQSLPKIRATRMKANEEQAQSDNVVDSQEVVVKSRRPTDAEQLVYRPLAKREEKPPELLQNRIELAGTPKPPAEPPAPSKITAPTPPPPPPPKAYQPPPAKPAPAAQPKQIDEKPPEVAAAKPALAKPAAVAVAKLEQLPQRPVKAFVPPPEKAKLPLPAQSQLDAPNDALTPNSVTKATAPKAAPVTTVAGLDGLPKRPVKEYTPPTAKAKAAAGAPQIDAPASAPANAPTSAANRVPPKTPTLAAGVGQLPNAPPPPLGNNARATAAVIALRDGKQTEAPADAERKAQFSQAKTLGTIDPGRANQKDGLPLPNVSVSAPPVSPIRPEGMAPGANAPPPKPFVPKGPTYVLRSMAEVSMNGFAIGLSPSARRLPAYVEKVFAGRKVYTAVVPMSKVPRHKDDWVVWFAESVPGQPNTLLRPPIPVRKDESSDFFPMAGESTKVVRVSVHVLISATGVVEVKRMTNGRTGAPIDAFLEADIARWTFRPAMAGGQGLDVEALFEIPYIVPGSP